MITSTDIASILTWFVMPILTNPVFSIATLLIGWIVGNRMAIGRDKRKEFNELIGPIRHDLFGIRNNPRSRMKGAWEITLLLIQEKLPFWRRKGFGRAIENYKNSKSDENINLNVNGMGGWAYKNSALIVNATNNLIKYLKPK